MIIARIQEVRYVIFMLIIRKKIEILQYKEKELFGLENNKVQQIVLSTPSCTLEEWNNDDVMRSMYLHYLRRQILAMIN